MQLCIEVVVLGVGVGDVVVGVVVVAVAVVAAAFVVVAVVCRRCGRWCLLLLLTLTLTLLSLCVLAWFRLSLWLRLWFQSAFMM